MKKHNAKNQIVGNWHGKRYHYDDNEKSTFNFLVSRLKFLKENFGVLGIKQSFEDEGAFLSDVVMMRRITDLCQASLYVKIGGCEAITDINNCVSMGVDYIIPPMIETEYAFVKFVNAVKNINDIKFYFLCETQTAFSNLEKILSLTESNVLEGIIIGRSDFTKSYGLDKSNVDSEFIQEKIRKAFSLAKSKNLKTTMGGNISVDSCKFIKDLFENKLIDHFETRNVVVSVNEKNISDLENTLTQIIQYEIDCLNFKSINHANISNAYLDRLNSLQSRIS
jgi:hypothetical protein